MKYLSIEERIAKRIAGEIVLSNKPWKTMRKWREMFKISQIEVASKMNISPSVISDYEGGRRKSPGSRFIKKFVETLIEIDKGRGGPTIKEFEKLIDLSAGAILDMREYSEPISVKELCSIIEAEIIACAHLGSRKIFGHTVVDSIRCIESLSGMEFLKLMGTTSMRALIFTKVSIGKSPMIAVRVHPIKPAAVIMHGTDHVDPLAIRLARIEQIPLALSYIENVDKMIDRLRRIV